MGFERVPDMQIGPFGGIEGLIGAHPSFVLPGPQAGLTAKTWRELKSWARELADRYAALIGHVVVLQQELRESQHATMLAEQKRGAAERTAEGLREELVGCKRELTAFRIREELLCLLLRVAPAIVKELETALGMNGSPLHQQSSVQNGRTSQGDQWVSITYTVCRASCTITLNQQVEYALSCMVPGYHGSLQYALTVPRSLGDLADDHTFLADPELATLTQFVDGAAPARPEPPAV